MKKAHEARSNQWLWAALLVGVAAASCARGDERGNGAGVPVDFDPLAKAKEMAGRVKNPEASVPPLCYTRTGGSSNPCWVCHTGSHGSNTKADWALQEEYSFSET